MLNLDKNDELVVEEYGDFVVVSDGNIKELIDLQRNLRGNCWGRVYGDEISFQNDRSKSDYWYDEYRPDLNWFKDYSNSEFREKMVELQKHLSLSRWFMCVNTTDHKEFIEWLDEDVDKVKAVSNAVIHLNKGFEFKATTFVPMDDLVNKFGNGSGITEEEKMWVIWCYHIDYMIEALEPLGWINKSACEILGGDPFNRNGPSGFDFIDVSWLLRKITG